MKLLLDANAFLWWRDDAQQLSPRVADAIRDRSNDIFVSVVSLWEIAIKRSIGKLRFLDDFAEVIAEEEFNLLPVSYAHLRSFENLPRHHRDPFDRMLIAQAVADELPIATNDTMFPRYGVNILW